MFGLCSLHANRYKLNPTPSPHLARLATHQTRTTLCAYDTGNTLREAELKAHRWAGAGTHLADE